MPFAAQRAQRQARRSASGGTRASNSALKSTWVHQQGGWGWPVARAASMAQPLEAPHSGQRDGSIPVPGPMGPPWPSVLPAVMERLLPQACALAFSRQACSSGSV